MMPVISALRVIEVPRLQTSPSDRPMRQSLSNIRRRAGREARLTRCASQMAPYYGKRQSLWLTLPIIPTMPIWQTR